MLKKIINLLDVSLKTILPIYLIVNYFNSYPVFAQDNFKLTESQKELIEKTIDGIELSSKYTTKIWKGYFFDKIPLIYYENNKQCFLFNYKDDLPEDYYFLKEFPNVAVKLKSDKFSGQFKFDVKIGTKNGVAMSSHHNFFTDYHETFHYYQNMKKFYRKNTNHNNLTDSKDITLIQLEQFYLSKALEAKDKNATLDNLKIFIAIRNKRNTYLKKSFIENEDSLEAIEGTANYVEKMLKSVGKTIEHQKCTVIFEPNYYEDIENIRLQLITELRQDVTSEFLTRRRYYLTGFAMGLILDELDKNWKEKMESGSRLIELVTKAINYKEDKNILVKIFRDNFYQINLMRNEKLEKQINEIKKARIAEFYSSVGTKIVVLIPFSFGALSTIGYNIVELPELGKYASLNGKKSDVSMETENLSFNIHDEYLSEVSDDYKFTFYSELLDGDLLINDKKIELKENKEFEGKIKLKNYKSKIIAKNSNIKFNNGTLTIKINDNK